MTMTMTHDAAVLRLRLLGYFSADTVTATPAEVRTRLKRFQHFNALPVTGKLDPQTVRLLSAPLRCSLPDFLVTDAGCCWPMSDMEHITYHTALSLPGLTAKQAAAAFDTACGQWAQVCGIRLRRVANAARANIAAKAGAGRKMFLDGAGGTLAWSYMPCNATKTTTLTQMYDQAERWSVRMAIGVMTHEIGHAIGLAHAKPGQLMAPYYSADITSPQKGDIAAAVKLYGPPVAQSRAPRPNTQIVRIKKPMTLEIHDEHGKLITSLNFVDH